MEAATVESTLECKMRDLGSLSGGSLNSCVTLTKALHPPGLTFLILQTRVLDQISVSSSMVQDHLGCWSKRRYLDFNEY